MLGNRGWLLKFSLPLLLFGALCALSAWQLPHARPGPRVALADPQRYDGKEIWSGVGQVEEILPDGFTFRSTTGQKVRVRSGEKPATERWVAVRGVFHAPDEIHAAAADVRVMNYYAQQRGGVYGLSAAVLLVWARYFLKRFRLGLRGGLFHPKPDAPGA